MRWRRRRASPRAPSMTTSEVRRTCSWRCSTSTWRRGVAPPDEAAEQFANIMLALGTGMGMLELADPGSVHPRLLGTVLALLIGTLESSAEARESLAEPASAAPRIRAAGH